MNRKSSNPKFSPGELSPQMRAALLAEDLSSGDFNDCLSLRRKTLIDDFRSEFEGKTVLEIGAHVGFFSVAIAKYAKKLVVIENNPRCLPWLQFQLPKKVRILHKDMHHELWRFKPGQFDVIVCAGILYHSASPFFLMEAMAYLRPKRLLLDSLLAPEGKDIVCLSSTPLNVGNYRYSYNPDSLALIWLSERAIDRAMRNLGFSRETPIRKKHLKLPPEQDSKYFREWKAAYSKWWSGPREN